MKQLTVESQGTPSLMLTHCWTEPRVQKTQGCYCPLVGKAKFKDESQVLSLVAKAGAPKLVGRTGF